MKRRIIYVNNQPIQVNGEIYQAYWKSIEQEKYQNKKARKHCLSLDHIIKDNDYNQIELEYVKNHYDKDWLSNQILIQDLLDAITKLNDEEQQLIYALYFEGLSQHEYATKLELSQVAILKRHAKIIKKLKKSLNL